MTPPRVSDDDIARYIATLNGGKHSGNATDRAFVAVLWVAQIHGDRRFEGLIERIAKRFGNDEMVAHTIQATLRNLGLVQGHGSGSKTTWRLVLPDELWAALETWKAQPPNKKRQRPFVWETK